MSSDSKRHSDDALDEYNEYSDYEHQRMEKYKKVQVYLIYWEDDPYSEQVDRLGRVFRDNYGYIVNRFPITEERHFNDPIDHEEERQDKLRIICYIGGAVDIEKGPAESSAPVFGRWYAVPFSTNEIDFGADDWINGEIYLGSRHSDTLIILDCNFEINANFTVLRLFPDLRHEIIATGIEDRNKKPGMLFDNVATVLEQAIHSPDQNQEQKQFTTCELGQGLIKMMEDQGEGKLFWTGPGFEKDRNNIALERILAPLTFGIYQEFGPFDSVPVSKPLELLYENGMTQVLKAEILPHMHSFGQSHLSVSQFYESKHVIC
ncbi:hypothetical protein GP486_006541 [Trichoglossum hirsutum]|uniref:Uncharacterized protein n=1 Tax=Trichoglossum hirsutum TaxID=265104 RepID=A0A9P8I7X9_9PEZI|nr:hypothetical protein GP486_006541 [Trichoglossum hirsutum]